MNSSSDVLWLFIKCILCLLCIACVAIIGLVAVASYYQPAAPPLLNFHRNNTDSLDHQFSQELVHYFPVGSEQSAMIRELSLEKFRLINDNKKPEKAATYDSLYDGADKKSFFDFCPCRVSATVHWTANKAGRIVSISGDYSEVCL